MNTPAIRYTPQSAHNPVIEQIVVAAKAIEGRARKRLIGERSARLLLETIDQHPQAGVVRRYSGDGFVANSYDYPAYITCAVATRLQDGTFAIGVTRVGAKRSYGQGALLTVDGKTA